jgi:hypothetical protein
MTTPKIPRTLVRLQRETQAREFSAVGSGIDWHVSAFSPTHRSVGAGQIRELLLWPGSNTRFQHCPS